MQSAFSKLGMSPETMHKFAPIVTDYVGKASGDRAKNALAGLLQ